MTSELIPAEPVQGEVVECDSFCTRCGSWRERDDAYCRRCGTALAATRLSAGRRLPTDNRGRNQLAPPFAILLNHRWVVISILLVAGPIGLPALWFSPRFSRPTKVIISLLYFALTAIAPLAAAWYWLDFAMRPLVDAFANIR